MLLMPSSLPVDILSWKSLRMPTAWARRVLAIVMSWVIPPSRARLRQALAVTGRAPGIFNADHGCQFTGTAWIRELERAKVRVSMDGKGRWMGNVFVERLWRAVKHEGGPVGVPERTRVGESAREVVRGSQSMEA